MNEKPVTLPRVVLAYKRNAGGGALQSAYRSAWLSVPSAKLAVHLAISGAADPGFTGIGFIPAGTLYPPAWEAVSSSWQLTPYVPPSDNGTNRPSPLRPVFSDTLGEIK